MPLLQMPCCYSTAIVKPRLWWTSISLRFMMRRYVLHLNIVHFASIQFRKSKNCTFKHAHSASGCKYTLSVLQEVCKNQNAVMSSKCSFIRYFQAVFEVHWVASPQLISETHHECHPLQAPDPSHGDVWLSSKSR